MAWLFGLGLLIVLLIVLLCYIYYYIRISLYADLISVGIYIFIMEIYLQNIISKFAETPMISQMVKPSISNQSLSWSVDYNKAEEMISQNVRVVSCLAFVVSILTGVMAHRSFYFSGNLRHLLSGSTFSKIPLDEFMTTSIILSTIFVFITVCIYKPKERYQNAIRSSIDNRTSFASASLEKLSTLKSLISECRLLAQKLNGNLALQYAEEVSEFIHQESACIFRGPEILATFIAERIKLTREHKKTLESLCLEFNTTNKLYKQFTVEASRSNRKSLLDMADVIGEGLSPKNLGELVGDQKYDDVQNILNAMQEQLSSLITSVDRINIDNKQTSKDNYYVLLEINQSATEDEIRIKIKEKKRSWTQRQNAPKLEQRQQASINLSIVPDIETHLLDPHKRQLYDQSL